jgi:hypothetical protein
MKTAKSIVLLTALLLSLVSSSIFGQDSDKPTVLVFSQNQAKLSDIGKINQMIDSVFSPILNKLVDEGKLSGWGQLNHAWGDEWNLNLWYSAKDLNTFNAAWDEYIKTVSEKHPGAIGQVVTLFQAHKDNIYSIRSSYYGK